MRDDISRLTDQITTALQDFSDVAGKSARRGYRDARSNVDSMMSDITSRGSAMAESAYDAANSFEESLEEIIAERPLATVGVALALGILIGITWRRS